MSGGNFHLKKKKERKGSFRRYKALQWSQQLIFHYAVPFPKAVCVFCSAVNILIYLLDVILAKITQLVQYKPNNNNTVCYVIILFWQELWVWEYIHLGWQMCGTPKLPVLQINFLSTTNFTSPQAPFYNINSLTDSFRQSQKCQIKLTSCGLPFPAAEHILTRQPLPARRANTPVSLRPAVTSNKIKLVTFLKNFLN